MQDLQATPKKVYTDFGSEFEDAFEHYCVENKIKMEKSCPYRAYKNGLVERCNRAISNLARTIMQHSGLPAEFWGHAVSTAAYTINRLSHRRLPGRITPYEAMFGTRPNVKNLRVFGCHAEILIEKQYRRKDFSQQVSDSAIFIGYCRQSTGYMFYIPSKHMVVSRRDATFNQAYLPARVGETTLIRTKTMIDGAGESGTIENDTKNSSNDTKTVQNDTKNSNTNSPDFDVSKSTPNESKTVLNGPKTTQNNTKRHARARNP